MRLVGLIMIVFGILCFVSAAFAGNWVPLKQYDLSNIEQIRNDWNVMTWLPGRVNKEVQDYVDSPENIYTENGHLVLAAVGKTRPCKLLHWKTIPEHTIKVGDKSTTEGQTSEECCNLCRHTPKCQTFVWKKTNENKGSCTLKDTNEWWHLQNSADPNEQVGWMCDITGSRLESKIHYSAAKMPGRKLRIEFVAKVPTIPGAFPALWYLGDYPKVYGDWPRGGEIDLMEWVQGINGFPSTLHYYSNTWDDKLDPKDQKNEDWQRFFFQLSNDKLKTQWTTFGVEYGGEHEKEYIQIYMITENGVKHVADTVYSSEWNARWKPESGKCTPEKKTSTHCTTMAPYDNDFKLIMNFAVGGVWAGMNVNSYDAFFQEGGIKFPIKSATVFEYKND